MTIKSGRNIYQSTNLDRTRILVSNDRPQFEELLNEHLFILNKKNVKTDVYKVRIDSYLDENISNQALFGYFSEKGVLISTIGLFLWPSLPYGTLSYMFSRKENKIFNSHNNGLNYCLHRCIEFGTTQNVKAYYSLQKAKSFYHKIRTWRRFDTPLTEKYYSVPELYIPANTKSSYSGAWKIMDSQVWPYDTILWCTRIKPSYEKMLNWGLGSGPAL